ncbi:hypothetical protein RND81_04G124900 [Saponaria officinalis]|uniref:Uncharacterized protein n=1 Tax=Saponaria officinalis TaxID=3572 RepID=A0AAW1LKI6_SAPOF
MFIWVLGRRPTELILLYELDERSLQFEVISLDCRPLNARVKHNLRCTVFKNSIHWNIFDRFYFDFRFGCRFSMDSNSGFGLLRKLLSSLGVTFPCGSFDLRINRMLCIETSPTHTRKIVENIKTYNKNPKQ